MAGVMKCHVLSRSGDSVPPRRTPIVSPDGAQRRSGDQGHRHRPSGRLWSPALPPVGRGGNGEKSRTGSGAAGKERPEPFALLCRSRQRTGTQASTEAPKKNWWADRSVYCPAQRRTSGRRAGEKRGFPPFRRRRARIRLCRPAREYRIFCRIISISENYLRPAHWPPENFSNGVNRLSDVQMALLCCIEPTSCFRKIFSRKMAKKSEILCQKTAHFNPDSPPRSRSARLCPAGRAGKPRRSISPAGPRPASPSSRSWGRCPAAPPRPRRAPRSGRRRRCARRR